MNENILVQLDHSPFVTPLNDASCTAFVQRICPTGAWPNSIIPPTCFRCIPDRGRMAVFLKSRRSRRRFGGLGQLRGVNSAF